MQTDAAAPAATGLADHTRRSWFAKLQIMNPFHTENTSFFSKSNLMTASWLHCAPTDTVQWFNDLLYLLFEVTAP